MAAVKGILLHALKEGKQCSGRKRELVTAKALLLHYLSTARGRKKGKVAIKEQNKVSWALSGCWTYAFELPASAFVTTLIAG